MKDCSNRKVFNWCWNDRSVDVKTTVSDSEFLICEAATGKARSPMVGSLKRGMCLQAIGADRERSARRPGMSAT